MGQKQGLKEDISGQQFKGGEQKQFKVPDEKFQGQQQMHKVPDEKFSQGQQKQFKVPDEKFSQQGKDIGGQQQFGGQQKDALQQGQGGMGGGFGSQQAGQLSGQDLGTRLSISLFD